MTTQRGQGRPKGGWIDDKERKPVVARIRERHRHIAELFARGLTRNEVASIVCMTPERVGQFYNDPAFQELIAQYRLTVEAQAARGLDLIALQREQMIHNNQRALSHVAQRLDEAEEAGESVPLNLSLRAIEIFSDRIGLGKHTTQTKVYDFASELETRRITRMKTIEAKVVPRSSPSLLQGGVSASPSTPPTNSSGDGSGRELEPVASPGSAPSLRRRAL